MPSCVVKHCKNSSQKQEQSSGLSFHRFPTSALMCKRWISIIRKSRGDEEWLPSKFCVVCSLHFEDADVYFTVKGRRLLRKTAKPTIDLYAIPPAKNESTESIGCTENKLDSAEEATTSTDPLTVPCKEEYEFIIINETETNSSLITDNAGISPNLYTGQNEEEHKIFLINKVEINSSVVTDDAKNTFEKMTQTETDSDDEEFNSIFDTPTEYRLRKQLKRQQRYSITARQKIHTLQGKVLRLQKRNAYLKDLLKGLHVEHS